MNVLVVVGRFPVLSETAILNQITGLLERGHQVTIYASVRSQEPVTPSAVVTHRLMDRAVFGSLPDPLEQYNVILCQYGLYGPWFLKTPVKLATCFRGYDLSSYLQAHPRVYDDLLRRGDLFLPVCSSFRQRLIDLGANPARVVVLHSAIDCSRFTYRARVTPSDHVVRLVTVGRLTEKKGIGDALSAVARLRKCHPRLSYQVIGDGPLRGSLEGRARELGLEPGQVFAGARPQEEIIEILDRAHLYLQPSVTAADGNQEGIPNALKEAMATGLPVVSTRHSGIPELVIDGQSGFLVPEHDVDALRDRLEYLLSQSEQWSTLGAAGRRKVEQDFDQRALADQLEQLLLGIAG